MDRLLGCTIASALVLAAGVAFAKPPVPISECGTVITEPGKYRVTQDLFCLPYQQGIQIFASDVTLDLKGHTITCDSSGEAPVGAVWVGDFFDPTSVVEKVWVKNGTVSGCNDAVIFFYGQSGKATKITATGNENGISVLEAKDTLIKNNVGFGNVRAINTFGGIGSKIRGNALYDNFDAAIALEAETDALVACNTSERDVFGVRIGPFSSGNVVRGNYVSNGGYGIALYGVGTPEQIFLPVASDNLIRKNIVQGSVRADLSETILNPIVGLPFVQPGCQNTWIKNQYGTLFGPVDCIAPPVELDDDDVCALDDDDDSDSDSDSDSD
jgi:hypothetical protein